MERLSLACLCLLTWSGMTSADGNGRVVVKEGSDALLPCSLSTERNIIGELFDWKKDGQREVFMYEPGVHYNNGRSGQDEQFKPRVSHFQDELKNGNASIIIRNTKVADSGNYTCVFPHLQPQSQTFLIELVVGAATEPYITTIDQTNNWSLLQCLVRGAFPKPKVEFKDSSGNVIPAPEPQVSERGGGGYNVTLKATVTKTDTFRCVVTQEEIHHQVYAETYVFLPTPPKNGAAQKMSVKILHQTNDGILLQCEVEGAFPKPKVEFKDSDGNVVPAHEAQVSERGGGYDIILQATVTKTDTFRCVVTQEEIHHQVYAETYVSPKGFPTGWVVGLLITFVISLVGGGLAVHCFWRSKAKKFKEGSQTERVPL
ncbi:butyrophilin subfamily 2 member A1-like isoform X2 [Chaetodon trifascialis]|uniref:butyrophilin subfamily 2 member A1-like isoform X2 n=1 Tax=Chaetodon trifascialis TaxID=109706 RepID=UPI0039939017